MKLPNPMLFNMWVSGFCAMGGFHEILDGDWSYAALNFSFSIANLFCSITLRAREV
jgi:hypothetical protein